MYEKQKHWHWILIAVITTLMLGCIDVTSAQSDIQVICASSTPQPIQTHLPGTYFHLTHVPYDLEANSNYRLEAMSTSGIKEFALPLSRELSRNLFTPSLSPDGHYMVFRPASSDVGLTVWDLQTNAITSLKLQPSDLEYLKLDFTVSYQRNQNLLIWLDSRHLLLNYYYGDLPTSPVDWVIGQKVFTIQETPLKVIEGKREDFDFPKLPLPDNSFIRRIEFSPTHQFATQLTEHLLYGDIGFRSQFEIYSVQNQTRVYNFSPTIERHPEDRPVWMPDEKTAFILTGGQNVFLKKVIELHIDDIVSEDQSLQEAINKSFGEDAGLTSMTPVVSPSGHHIMFGVYVPTTRTRYLLEYMPTTKQLAAFCDPGPGANNDETYPFWYSNEQYFAYYNNGQLYVINLSNDAIYTLPSDRLFVGWSDYDILASSKSSQ